MMLLQLHEVWKSFARLLKKEVFKKLYLPKRRRAQSSKLRRKSRFHQKMKTRDSYRGTSW